MMSKKQSNMQSHNTNANHYSFAMTKYITKSILFLSIVLLGIGCSEDEADPINPDNENSENSDIQFEDNDISFNLVNLKWSAVSGPNNEEVVYDIYLGDTKIKDSNEDTDYTLTKLEANTEYSGRIVPKTVDSKTSLLNSKTNHKNAKESIELDPISFTVKTKQFADPSAPTPEISNVTVNDIINNGATLNWDTATISDGSQITYNIYLEGDLIANSLTNNTYIFENLEPKTLYKGILLAISTNQKSVALDFEFTTLPSSDEIPLTGFAFFRGASISYPASDWLQLIPIFSPIDANAVDLNWTSSDESIATVDESGYVHTKPKIGVITITASSVDNPQITQSIEITVTERIPNGDRFISTQPRRSSILIGSVQKIQINDFNVKPDDIKDFVFTSSDPSIATVDNDGNVAGVALGTVAITATSASNPDLTDSVMLRVVKDPIPITDFIFYYDNPRSLFVGQQQNLYPKILPVDATNQELIFTSTNPSILEISRGFAKAITPGNTSVIITSVEDNSISETRDFNVIPDPITLNQNTGLYTAPANSEVVMQLFAYLDVDPQSSAQFTEMTIQYSVKDSSGTELLNQSNPTDIVQINVSENPDGTKYVDAYAEAIKFQMPADGKVTISIVEVRLFNSQDFFLQQLDLDITNNQGPRKTLTIPIDSVILD
ncbi:Ig-like domain-containing protein [Aquimarina algiphila]|uniref:Ig-like domain-containing protein n=1 Tax=Aquimarina algiphila TaxID=2047982 RepID=UPI00232DF426|nr:Ig-like domain-containing protein [Aquimarina algiphila]